MDKVRVGEPRREGGCGEKDETTQNLHALHQMKRDLCCVLSCGRSSAGMCVCVSYFLFVFWRLKPSFVVCMSREGLGWVVALIQRQCSLDLVTRDGGSEGLPRYSHFFDKVVVVVSAAATAAAAAAATAATVRGTAALHLSCRCLRSFSSRR